MTLPATNSQIDLNQVNIELGIASGTSINMDQSNLRTLFGKTGSGTTISMSDGWGKSNFSAGTTFAVMAPGWGGGGNYGSQPGSILNYTTQAVGSDGLTIATQRDGQTGAWTTSYGYFLGGRLPGNATTTEIDGVNLSTLAYINPAAALPTATSRQNGSGGVSSSSAAYNLGVSYATTAIQKMLFSTEATSTLAATLAQGRTYAAPISHPSAAYGFVGGGGPANVTQIDGIQYSTEARSDPAAALVQARFAGGGTSSSTKGFFGGGALTFSSFTTQIDALTYATLAASDPAAALAQSRWGVTGMSSSTQGFYCGGYNPASTEIDGITFATEAAFNPSTTLKSAMTQVCGVQK